MTNYFNHRSLQVAFLAILISISAFGQKKKNNATLSVSPSTFESRMKSFEERGLLQKESLFLGVPATNIGPSIMSGRVVDLEVDPSDTHHFYVAYASGGLWETKNNGMSFDPLFDREAVMTIGDIAVDWNSKAIWIGTGECNSSRSSYSGMGMYLSEDQGKTWQFKGLGESHHIGKISINPANPNDISVAVLGHLYSSNADRGIYRTTDKGRSWQKVLYINENTGGIDLARDTEQAEILYASCWERERRAWNFSESGLGSGIWKSSNSGAQWEKITSIENGFPSGPDCGRIGLAYYSYLGEKILYAMVDNQSPGEEKKKNETTTELKKDDFKNMSIAQFLALNDSLLNKYLKQNGFPNKYDAKSCKDLVSRDKIKVIDLFDYLHDANEELFNVPVKGAEVYKLEGNRWIKTHDSPLDDVVYSYGYYFGLIRVHPKFPNRLYIAGVPLLYSQDFGKTFHSLDFDNVHADHHALWINPDKDAHLINGNDGGLNISYDNGKNYIKCNSPAVGQFYTVNVDDAQPYNVYGGLQDNGVWKGPSKYNYSTAWHQEGKYPYESIMGGDGMQVQVDKRDNSTIYTGYQFGHYYRISNGGAEMHYIHPKHDLGERPLRWNWQTPIHLSIHNQDILYMCSNRFHRSMDQGNTWETLSDDLTQGAKEGNVPFGTLTCIHESPLQFGLIYVASDDGLIHVSKDAGNTWARIDATLPQNMWVSRIKASNHDKNRVYVTLNGYRKDHFESYVYRSENMGKTWQRIGNNLPEEPINVLLEDSKNPELLYVGTDHGLYLSTNGGSGFIALANMPAVPVHDLAVQEREEELIVGTHGRSLYKIPLKEIRAVADWKPDTLAILAIADTKHSTSWGESWSKWIEPEDPTITISVFQNASAPYSLEIITDSGITVQMKSGVFETKGLNYFQIIPIVNPNVFEAYIEDLKEQNIDKIPEPAKNGKTYLLPGKYQVKITCGDKIAASEFIITNPE